MRLCKYHIIFTLLAIMLNGCNQEHSDLEPEPTPMVPVLPEDSMMLYNGIALPDQWPPQRSYSLDIRKGMSPFYLINKPGLIHISMGRQLFVDDFLIENTTLERTYYYPEYYEANPILYPDKEWENMGTKGAAFAAPFSDGVWYDETEGKYKMWYMAGGGKHSVDNAPITCYAESVDGLNWVKPALAVVSGTNIIDRGSMRDASVVWLDKQETNQAKRYKMFQVAGGKGNWKYHYKTSADGKQWRDNLTPSQAVADRSTVYKNPFRNIWVWSMRHNIRVNASDTYTVRARDYYENADPVIGNQNAKAELKSFWFGPWPNEQKHPFYHNDDGSPGIYNLDATPYESLLLGFFSVWQGPENDVCLNDNVVKRNQIMVGYSRDGYSWYREDMNPFLAVDEDPAAWNSGNLQSVVGTPIIVGDKLYFYLSGRRLEGANEITSTGMAMLRRDGFASMRGTGELLTPKLKFTGSYFFVNAKISGELRVELLDEAGQVIPGFAKSDCKPIAGDKTKQRIGWEKNSTLDSLKGTNIKVKFYVTEGEIFSFWISPEITGESQGYTAGGGPGLNESGIDKNSKD